MPTYPLSFWDTIKHFKPAEFDSPDIPGSGTQMDVETVKKLDSAREIAGIPFKIASGFRSIQHNKAVGGTAASGHLRGRAVDIVALTSHSRYLVVTSLLRAGFVRIEVGETHVHADTMTGTPYPQGVLLLELGPGQVV